MGKKTAVLSAYAWKIFDAHVYVLRSPRTRLVRYVGLTTNPIRRLASHFYDAKRDRSRLPVRRWIAGLLANGQRPILEIIESGDLTAMTAREIFWIDHYRTMSNRILNVLDGPTPVVPPEARVRAGAKFKGRALSPEHRRKISEAKTGCKRPDAAALCLAMAAANKGRKMVLSAAERQRRGERIKRVAFDFAKETDEQAASRRNKTAKSVADHWAAMTEEQRAERGLAISEGRIRELSSCTQYG